MQGQAEPLLVHFTFWLNGDGNNRLGKLYGFEYDGSRLITEGITGGGAFQAHSGRDVTRANLFELFPLVGMHLEKPADPLSSPFRRIVNVRPSSQHAGIDTKEGQRSNIRIRHNFEGQGREWAIRVWESFLFILRNGMYPQNRRNVQR